MRYQSLVTSIILLTLLTSGCQSTSSSGGGTTVGGGPPSNGSQINTAPGLIRFSMNNGKHILQAFEVTATFIGLVTDVQGFLAQNENNRYLIVVDSDGSTIYELTGSITSECDSSCTITVQEQDKDLFVIIQETAIIDPVLPPDNEPVPPSNAAPVISGLQDQTIEAGSSKTIDLTEFVEYEYKYLLTYTIVNAPEPGAGISISGAFLNINPAEDWNGSTIVSIQVQDSAGLTSSATFLITVTAPPPPSITIYNRLLTSIRVYINGSIVDQLKPSGNETYTLESYPAKVDWEVIPLVNQYNGGIMGESGLGGGFTSVNPGSELNIIAKNGNIMFVYAANYTTEDCSVVINDGYLEKVDQGFGLPANGKEYGYGYYTYFGEEYSNVAIICPSGVYHAGKYEAEGEALSYNEETGEVHISHAP